MNFKSHMIFWAEYGEGFRTVCGIDDGCSERFYEDAELFDFGDETNTTCKRCLSRFKKLLTEHDRQAQNQQ